MPSYMKEIDGFTLDYSHIITSVELHNKLNEYLQKNRTKEEFEEILWGDEEKRTYKLYKIYEIDNKCSRKMMIKMLSDLKEITDAYDKATRPFPTAIMIALTILDMYLLRGPLSIHRLTLGVFYSYLVFFTLVFYFYMTSAIRELPMIEYGCLESSTWRV